MIHDAQLFNNIVATDLMPYLIEASNGASYINDPTIKQWNWHICWLNNDNQPIIGLLPRVAWTVLPSTLERPPMFDISDLSDISDISIGTSLDVPISVIKTQRPFSQPRHNETTRDKSKPLKNTANCTHTYYRDWIQALILYSNEQLDNSLNKPLVTSQSTTETDFTASSYNNGLMGFIGYDIGAKALSPLADIELANQPCSFLGHYDIYLKPLDNHWRLHIQTDTDDKTLTMLQNFLQDIDTHLQNLPLTKADLSQPSLPLKSQWQFDQYQTAFEQVQHYLYAGDSYQINLTQKWQSASSQFVNHDYQTTHPHLVNYLPKLYENTTAPFAGYIAVKTYGTLERFELLSCSPELFVTFTTNHNYEVNIISKPIKGTRPRATVLQTDEQLKNELANSEKDRAENVMIVDLLRNDLGKYAKVGSVQVPKLFAIESFSNVHHMVSTVTATIKDAVHPLIVLFDSLPAGSITGTPKKRAVEIINELEIAPRGAYCGTMGYMNFDGTGQWNVLIRTLQSITQNQKTEINLWAGGGITVGSQCNAEYQECLDKVGNLLGVLEGKE